MRFSLQTLILATVLLALALAAFGAFGIAILVVLVLADAAGRQQRSKREAIGCALATATCSLMLIGLVLLPFTLEPTSHAGRRLQCQNNLKQLATALFTYHEAHGCFPPAYIRDKAGKPMHSWRVLILPYIGCDRIYRQYDFNEPWDGPNNRRLAGQVPGPFFYCLNSETARDDPGTTNYLAVVGQNTAWPGAESFCLDRFQGSMSRTILLVEVGDSDVNWMEPRDLSLEEARATTDPKSGLSVRGSHPGTNVAMLDGSVRLLPERVAPGDLENLLSTDREGIFPKAAPTRPKPISPRLIAALAFLIIFILYVIRRNKDAAAFAARGTTSEQQGLRSSESKDELTPHGQDDESPDHR